MVGCAEPTPPPRVGDVDVVLPGFDSLRVRLVDGSGEVRGSDDVVVARVGLTDFRVVDDLDGDGLTDAVVIGWSSGGGSGTFIELMHFVAHGDRVSDVVWTWAGSVLLGDRVRVRALAATGDRIEVHTTEHGENDPLCCPTVDVLRVYGVSDGILREAGR
jgi:hypothetical protein